MEYTYLPNQRFSLQTGLRYDNNSIHGGFITPRLHMRYEFAKESTIRIAAGSGRRTSYAIAENSYLLASSRSLEIADDLKQEKGLELWC